MIQFNRNVKTENFIVSQHKHVNEKILEFEIKQKTTTAFELNEVIKKFAKDNLIDDLDSNTLQLVTEELVVMILLPLCPAGMTMQYSIAYNYKKATLTMGMGYPGSYYNPFEMEQNIYMINIFKEWFSDIQFHNTDGTFNELFLTTKTSQAGSVNDQLIDDEPTSIVQNPQIAGEKSIFDPECGKIKRDSVPSDEIVLGKRESVIQILELLIREKGISKKTLFESIDSFAASLDLQEKNIMFDNSSIAVVGSIKFIGQVILNDLNSHFAKEKKHIEFKLLYLPDDNEVLMQFSYPNDEYYPFSQNKEEQGIKVINGQSSVNTLYSYKNGINKLIITLSIEDAI